MSKVKATVEAPEPVPPRIVQGVPVWRFYTMAVLMGFLGFLAGNLYGRVSAENANATTIIDLQEQHNAIISEEFESFTNSIDDLDAYLLRE